jgi:hypothetical protein
MTKAEDERAEAKKIYNVTEILIIKIFLLSCSIFMACGVDKLNLN